MTDTSGTTATPQPDPAKWRTGPERPPRFPRLQIAFGMLPQPDGKPPFIWVERWDSKIVAFLVAFGLPLLALANLADLTRWKIGAVWFAFWAIFYIYFEGRELVGQMQGRGSIKPEQLAEQQNSAQYPFFGCIAAAVIWVVVWAVHVALKKWPDGTTWELVSGLVVAGYTGLWTTPIPYGWVEWFILLQVWFGTRFINYIMYNTGNIFSKAAPMGERIERRAP